VTDVAIRVLVVDDHAVVRRGMRAFLSMLPDIEVVGEARDGEAALEFLRDCERSGAVPDVVLMDLIMPRLEGIETTVEIHQRYPDVKVIAMTSFSESERVYAVLQAGAAGYVLKDAEADEVADAIRAAYRGEMPLDSAVARKLTRAFVEGHAAASLTEREREVLILVARGESNQAIADKLMISERTARAHVSSVLNKLGFASRTQAAVWAIQQGLVSTA
jgi:DNA-binding NarL/FixJ family response regulator